MAPVLCTDHVVPDPLVRQGFGKAGFGRGSLRLAGGPRAVPSCSPSFSLVDHFEGDWICREVPEVLLIIPNPLPLTMFEGSPKFTILKMLKNSARNSSVPIQTPPRCPKGVSLISAKSKS